MLRYKIFKSLDDVLLCDVNSQNIKLGVFREMNWRDKFPDPGLKSDE